MPLGQPAAQAFPHAKLPKNNPNGHHPMPKP
jgi:hypothetical protein